MMKNQFVHILSSGLCCSALGLVFCMTVGCGSGAPGSGNPPPPGDFSISASPAGLVLGTGGSQAVTVSVAEVNGFTSSVNVTVSGLPAGVTASPATFNLTPGSQQTITLGATLNAQAGAGSITFTGTSGNLKHSAQTSLSVVATVTSPHPPIRTQYVRTNSYYDSTQFQIGPPQLAVFDSSHAQFFVSNTYMNEIEVFSASTETQTASIPVATPMGIDISPVDGSLWAGTLLGDVYHIDTSKLSVIARYPSSTIGPKGFVASATLALADGRLALQQAVWGSYGVIFSGGGLIVWDPQTNAVDVGNANNGSICAYGPSILALDGTRRLILAAAALNADSIPLCSYDTTTRVETDGVFIPSTNGDIPRQIVAAPDGSKFFLTTGVDGVEIFDSKTLEPLGQIAPTPTTGVDLPNGAAGGVMSLDGKTLYLAGQENCSILGYDTGTYQQVIKAAHPMINSSFPCMSISAIDGTGLIIGLLDHGVGFADGSLAQSNSSANNARLSTPPATDSGPLSGGTAIAGSVTTGSNLPFSLSKFYVGNALNYGAILGTDGTLSATTAPASSGMAVDLTAVGADGSVALAPEGFSYGPTILEVVPNAATADGGQQGVLIGYGFGSSVSGVQVTVGGQAAEVQDLHTSAPIEPYPFWVEGLTFTIPAGTSGQTTITVKAPSGIATALFNYTPKSVSYPLNAVLQEGVYDAHRDLYFFTDTAQIQVLSASTGTWQTPISLPGITSASQLLAISESPNESLLAVGDFGGDAIFVLNPDNPASVKRYSTPGDTNGPRGPVGLAVLDDGDIYFSTGLNSSVNPGGSATIDKLSTSNGQIKSLLGNVSGSPESMHIRILLSADQTKVYCEATPYWIDTSTDTVNTNNTMYDVQTGQVDGAVSGDGSTVFVSGLFTDAIMNPLNAPAYIDWETWLPVAVYGQKLNQDGSILYQPLTNGVDMIERNTGRLLYRTVIPETVAGAYDAMFLGASPGTLGFITSTGVTIVDLSSLSIPASASSPFSAVHALAADRENLAQVPVPDSSKLSRNTKRQGPRLRHIGDKSKGPHY